MKTGYSAIHSKTFDLPKPKQKVSSGRTAAKYAVYFLVMLLLSLAEPAKDMRPFGWGAYLALCFAGQSIPILTPLYIIAGVIANPTLAGAINAVTATAVLMIVYAIHHKMRKKVKMGFLWLYGAAGQAGYVYFCVVSKTGVIPAALTLVIGILFMYAAVVALNACVVRGLKYRLNRSEYACIGIVITAAGIALAGLDIFGFRVIVLAAAVAILIASHALGTSYSVGIAVCLGAGAAFYDGQIAYAAAFVVMALASSVFTGVLRIPAAVSIIFADVIFGYYFNAYYAYGWLQILPLAVGAAVYLVLPERTYRALGEAFLGTQDKNAMRYLINRNRQEISQRLVEVSGVFAEMQGIFSSLVRGGVNREQAKELLCAELCTKLCEGCKMSGQCFGEYRQATSEVFLEIMTASLEKDKATIMDLSPFITGRCVRLSGLVSISNQLAAEYKNYNSLIESAEKSKAMLGEQMGGMSRILLSLAEDARTPVSFNIERERNIIEELTYADIICSEAVVTESVGKIIGVTIVVKTDTFRREPFLKTVSKACRTPMEIVSFENSVKAEWSVAVLEASARYDVVFGCASAGKGNSGEIGDTHSFVKISGGKFLMALSDGMGSGHQARAVSSTAISLVENFYKAGFESELIISNVNKLLSVTTEESYSAVDICVVDLMTGQADILKIGSPDGYIKRKDETETVSGGALPLGIMEEIRPFAARRLVFAGDMVVFCSDGVTDCFPEGGLREMINTTRTVNPQSLCEAILKYCYAADKSLPHDDMTVVALRLFEK